MCSLSEFHEYLDKRYALALYEVSEEKNKTKEYLEELREVIKIIDENAELFGILKHPDLSTSKKKRLFEDIFKGKIENDILSFLLILIDKNRILELDGILQEIENIHLGKNRTLVAHIKTVIPLNEEERKALINKLEKKYDKKVILDEEIDSEIIGGVFVKIGDDIIDGTIKSRYEAMKRLSLKSE